MSEENNTKKERKRPLNLSYHVRVLAIKNGFYFDNLNRREMFEYDAVYAARKLDTHEIVFTVNTLKDAYYILSSL